MHGRVCARPSPRARRGGWVRPRFCSSCAPGRLVGFALRRDRPVPGGRAGPGGAPARRTPANLHHSSADRGHPAGAAGVCTDRALWLRQLLRAAGRALGDSLRPHMVFHVGRAGRPRHAVPSRPGLGAPVLDIYGCTEVKEIAWQCSGAKATMSPQTGCWSRSTPMMPPPASGRAAGDPALQLRHAALALRGRR
jgi:hypothetical protein